LKSTPESWSPGLGISSQEEGGFGDEQLRGRRTPQTTTLANRASSDFRSPLAWE
jgi:hypothetical protein